MFVFDKDHLRIIYRCVAVFNDSFQQYFTTEKGNSLMFRNIKHITKLIRDMMDFVVKPQNLT